jgi:hypothetical protein
MKNVTTVRVILMHKTKHSVSSPAVMQTLTRYGPLFPSRGNADGTKIYCGQVIRDQNETKRNETFALKMLNVKEDETLITTEF